MTSEASQHTRQLEPILDGLRRAGLGVSTGYRLIKAAQFPRQVKIGRGSYLVSREVDAWIDARVAERDARPGDDA